MPNSFSTTKSDPNEDLYRQAERLGHRVVWYRFRNAPCLTIEDGDGGIAIGIVVLFTLLVVAYVVDGWSQRGEIPRGTSIGGVAVGGRTPEQAQYRVE